MAEASIESFISKRHSERVRDEGERPHEVLYADSVRRHEERERRQQLWEKLRYHEHMIRSHTATSEAIVGNHREELQWCEAMLGLNGHRESA
jgi:hypothetical protein